MSPAKYRVGIDLGPAGLGSRAPGTARHVTGQARALFQLDVPWTWVPVLDSATNPLHDEVASLHPRAVQRPKTWVRSTVDVGRAWTAAGCHAGFATAYFVPWSGCPVVANFFDTNVYEFGWTWIRSGRRWNYYLNRALSTYSLWRARRLFLDSNYCAGVLREKFPRWADKACVLYPGVTPLSVAPEKPAALAGLDRPHVLYVGDFSENKNQRRLIEAWARWQRIETETPPLVLVGRCGDDFLHGGILPAIAAAPRPREIILAGYVSDAELAWCYAHAALYVQPSFAEGFGLPVIEAMGQGVPTAISRSTSLPEVGGDAAAYFDPADADSIARTVRELWHDPARQELLRARGLLRPALFTWDRNARQVAAEIELVLAGR